MMDGTELLRIEGLSVSFASDGGPIEVVSGVSLEIRQGRTLALVGESGCGKSVTASSVMRLLPQPHGTITAGRILLDGENVLDFPVGKMYTIRGGSVSMIFQEPMTALNPVHTVRRQISEVFELHRDDVRKEGRELEVLEALRKVEMPSPESRLGNYPFQLSGGMRQRVMIAMALSGHPRLLIADEPTTALDVTVQAQILALIRDLQKRNGMGVLYITHDMGVVAEMADDVAVMYAGQVVESGPVGDIFARPTHPYTRGLIASRPSMTSVPKSRLPSIEGVVPAPANYPATCRFANRCLYAQARCSAETPDLLEVGPGHRARCLRTGEI